MGTRKKNPHAVALGKKGGSKGGRARWVGLSDQEKSELMRRAVQKRWARTKRKGTRT